MIRIAVIVILFIIALALYNNRKLENSEEIVVFDILKKAFVAVVSVCVGVFGYMVICATVGKNSILFMLPLGIVAVVVTHMLNNKSISIRGSLKPIAIYTVFVALIYAVFEFNLTGYETRFPNADDVESMSSYTIAQTSYPMDLVWTDGLAADNVPSGEAYDKDFDHTLYTEKNDIERMIEWQKNIVADKDEMLKLKYSTYDSNHNYDDEYWDTVEFVYNLKNGKTLKRIYNIEVSNDKQYVEYRRSEGYKNLYLQYLRDDAIIRSVDLNALVIEKDGKFTFVDDDFDSRPEGAVDKSYVFNDGDIDFDKLLEAIKEDTKSMPEFKSNYNSYIDITYSLPVVVNGRKASLLMSSNLPVSDTYSHTKAFMQQYLH